MVSLIKKVFVRFTDCTAILFLLCGCSKNIGTNIIVEPKDFKIQVPYESNKEGIVINTSWGADKVPHKLYLDNHSPSWANSKVLKDNSSIKQSNDLSYRTTTADGTFIQDNVYICDQITFDSVTFKNVPFYKISNRINLNQNTQADGVLGENIMSSGTWKIYFKNKIITFASNIDSIEDMQEATLFPAHFTDNAIEIETTFRNNIKKKVELDLGYNGWIIMPSKDFIPIAAGNNKIGISSFRFSTPASSEIIKNTQTLDSIRIDQSDYNTVISSNESVKEVLIGLAFFAQFDFLIIDYPGKSIYISKNRLDK